MPLPGTLLHYRILHAIGKGGMGEVYAADDTRLHRKVALKVLPAIFAIDPERRERFEREARAIAALNHPNIVTIYSVEEADGVPFLTMELVEGKPLSEMIPPGGMPTPLLLRIATAIADAMAAAQQRGITHRDLKPANVMVTGDGRVKVLDFGLARLQEQDAPADDLTRLNSDVTSEGKIIGTVAYMSPEQAEGKPVDPRSDIFSLGVILHEMATGDRPFKGDTNVSIISAILKDTPSSVTDLNPTLPPDLTRIVRRCLAKDPTRRFQSAADVRSELEDLTTEVTAGSGVTPRPQARSRGMGTWVAGGLVLAAVVAAALYFVVRGRNAPPPTSEPEFTIGRLARLTTSGTASIAALSKDGRYIVHVKSEEGDPSLWVRQTATSSDVRIVPPAPVSYDGLVFSPDGNYVYYNTYRRPGGGVATLYKIPTLGGSPTAVIEDVDSAPAFSPDGSQFAFMRGLIEKGTTALMVANADGTNAHELTSLRPPDRFQSEMASWSPDGKTLLATATRNRYAAVFAVDVATARATPVGGTWAFLRTAQWMPDGHSFLADAVDTSLAATSPQIWRVSYPAGVVARVTNDLNTYLGISLSADGHTLATIQGEVSAGLSRSGRGDRSWTTLTAAGTRADGTNGVALLTDGRIVYSSAGSGVSQLSIMNADGTGPHELTPAAKPAGAPSASADGRWIYFQVFSKEGVCLYRVGPDGSGLQQITTEGDEAGPVVSPDGRTVYFSRSRSGQPHPAKVSADGGQLVPLGSGTDYFRVSHISADGTTLLGQTWDVANRRPAMGLLKADGSGGVQLLQDVQSGARFLRDGSIVYADRRQRAVAIMVKPPDGGAPKPFAPPVTDSLFNADLSPDGRTMVISHGRQTTDVVLITAAAAPKQP